MSANPAPRTAPAPSSVRFRPRKSLVALALAVSVSFLAGCLTYEQDVVLNHLNNSRRAHGRSSLPIHWQAQTKAQAWAEKLARDGRLSHSNLRDGITDRWCSLAENVGYGSNAHVVQKAYMNSPGHRANILNTSFNGVGVGYAKSGGRVYTVQVFIQTC